MNAVKQKHEAELTLINERLSKLENEKGIKELAQKLFERVRINVQKRIERYQWKLNDHDKGMGK